MKHAFLVSLLLVVTAAGGENFSEVETDKVHFSYQSDHVSYNDNEVAFIETPQVIEATIKWELENVTNVEFDDVSTGKYYCVDQVPKSPSKIMSYTFDPKAKIKHITFRIRLPCAAYHKDFQYLIKIKTPQRDFFMRKKFRGVITYHHTK